MKRGTIVIASGRGEYSRKPRPALVVQNSLFNGLGDSVILCPITTHLTGNSRTRVAIAATLISGLVADSEVEVDKIEAVRLSRIRETIGRATIPELLAVNAALRLWLDL